MTNKTNRNSDIHKLVVTEPAIDIEKNMFASVHEIVTTELNIGRNILTLAGCPLYCLTMSSYEVLWLCGWYDTDDYEDYINKVADNY